MKALLRERLVTVTAWWLERSLREQVLIGAAAVGVLLILFWATLLAPALARVDTAHERVDATAHQLEIATRLQDELAQVEARLGHVEERLRNGPRGELFTILETLANQSEIQVTSVEPQVTSADGHYQESVVEVVLTDVSLAQAVSFLHRIETAAQLLSVKRLRLRSRSDPNARLDITFTVSSFETRP